jgi:hypothetical protein
VKLKLNDGDYIITAYAQLSAVGWANAPIWVIVANGNHKLREECIQPKDQTAEMITLYRLSAEAHGAMKRAVIRAISKKRVRAKK